jgi:D-glycero-D-manno-heptose 1,7-bisphosphate phosphatase
MVFRSYCIFFLSRRDFFHLITGRIVPDPLRKALFIDRDGVVNEDTGYPFLPGHIRFNEAIFPLCLAAVKKGYLLVVITNQAGVAKGKFTENDVNALHEWMAGEFKKRGIIIARFYYCPHHPEAAIPKYRVVCNCRKPKPGMIEQATKDLNLDLKNSLVIGDKHSDRIELPGLKSIVVKSRYTGNDFNVEDLACVADYL